MCWLLWWLVCALLLQVFVHYLFQALRVVAMTLVSAVSTPGHRDDGIYFLSFLLNDLVVLLEYFMGESEFQGMDHRQCLCVTCDIHVYSGQSTFSSTFAGLAIYPTKYQHYCCFSCNKGSRGLFLKL